jgi:hypothetical protein
METRTSKNYRLIAALVLAIVLGLIAAIALFIAWQSSINNDDLAGIGVISPNNKLFAGASWQQQDLGNNYHLYSDDSMPEVANSLAEILKADVNLQPLLPSGHSTDINLIVSNKINHQDLNKSGAVVELADVIGYSGNNLLFAAESQELLKYPDRFSDNLVAGIAYAGLYNSLSATEVEQMQANKTAYNLNSTPTIASYLNISKGDAGDWKNPYPHKTTEYAGVSEICHEVTTPIRLFECELVLMSNGNAEKVPPDQRKFFTGDLEVAELLNFKALGRSSQADLGATFVDQKLKVSGTKYAIWAFSDLSEADYIVSENNYFQNINADKLAALESALEKLGFSEKKISETVNDKQFGAPTYFVSYKKQGPLTTQHLNLRVLDTNKLNADCIVEGQGSLFCDGKSIYKNSQNYLQIVLAESAKF